MSDKYLTISDVAEKLGVKKGTIYAWLFQKRLPCIKLTGKMVRFRESDLEAWLKSKTTQPAEAKPLMKRGRPPKVNSGFQDEKINRLVQAAKNEVLKN